MRCTHGATLSQVDREQLFYAMARGLSASGGGAPDRARLLPGRARPHRARAGPRGARPGVGSPHPGGLAASDAVSAVAGRFRAFRFGRGHEPASRLPANVGDRAVPPRARPAAHRAGASAYLRAPLPRADRRKPRARFPFGIVYAYEDGLRQIGTLATVTEVVERSDDGRLNILVEGRARFRLARADRRDEPSLPAAWSS